MRKDLNMRKGKMVAQGAHASMAVILNFFESIVDRMDDSTKYFAQFEKNSPVQQWLEGKFTKICVSVDSEQQLIEIFNDAQAAKLPCAMITDSGLTEFNGVPTKTCCAIGPWHSEEIDKITGHLKLL